MNLRTQVIWIGVCFFATGCGDDGSTPAPIGYDDTAIQDVLNLPSEPFEYAPTGLPTHFTSATVTDRINTPSDNPITDVGATLGRVLFYDTLLSSNETIACASCHKKDFGFSDNQALSDGFEGGKTGRNSMSLVNVRYYEPGAMFWDERAASLEHQVLLPIQDAVEMGMELPDVVARLQATAHYPLLFEKAFGDSEITSDRVSLALAQFVRAMVSFQSSYDVGIAAAGDPRMDFASFSAQENLGKRLFFSPPGDGTNPPGGNCAVCHVAGGGGPGVANTALFFLDQARNNGLSADTSADQGVGAVTGRTQDNGLFKSSSLRNIEQTAPYMHDGSLATLRNVVEHYNSGVAAHENLDNRLRTPGGDPQRLGLNAAEVDAIVAFLRTLTDDTLASDERFANPFR